MYGRTRGHLSHAKGQCLHALHVSSVYVSDQHQNKYKYIRCEFGAQSAWGERGGPGGGGTGSSCERQRAAGTQEVAARQQASGSAARLGAPMEDAVLIPLYNTPY